jgi:MFS family permease
VTALDTRSHAGAERTPTVRGSTPRTVLLLVVGLHLVAETALTPFLPQLFRTLYGIDDLGATGAYVWVARVVGFCALPLWGLAARRWPLHRLVVTGLVASVFLDAALGFAPNYPAFTGLTAAVVATNAALLLAYPALIATYGDHGDRLPGVRAYVTVFHAAVAVSTLVGAAVLALPDPRFGISSFALLDATLAVLCLRVLGRSVVRPVAVEEVRPRSRARGIVAIAALAVVFEAAANVIRPFFTEYAAAGGFGTTAAAALFLVPNVAALAAMPFADRFRRRAGPGFLPLAFVLAALGLAWQVVSPDLLPLLAGRVVFGVGLGLSHVALDLRMFEATGTAGPGYVAVETARVGALFVTPLLATAAASYQLALPLALAAVLYVAAAALSPRLAPRPVPEESRV